MDFTFLTLNWETMQNEKWSLACTFLFFFPDNVHLQRFLQKEVFCSLYTLCLFSRSQLFFSSVSSLVLIFLVVTCKNIFLPLKKYTKFYTIKNRTFLTRMMPLAITYIYILRMFFKNSVMLRSLCFSMLSVLKWLINCL